MAEYASPRPPVRGLPWYVQALIVLALGAAAAWWGPRFTAERKEAESAPARSAAAQAEAGPRTFRPTPAQWSMLSIVPVEEKPFRVLDTTEGKIAVDEDNNTPIFPPYSGRVIRLFAKPGDQVRQGQVLFTIEAADMVQAQNDFLAARAAVNKAQSQVNLTQTNASRQRELFRQRAVAQKALEQAEADLVAAQNDLRTAQAALEAVRSRLRILGKSDQDIAAFESKGSISPETPIHAPLAGTIVQRKVGPGQYVGSGASDPVFVIGDLSRVWLVASVRETDAPRMRVGDPVEFSVLSLPDRVFTARISYVAALVDPGTRRLPVRADVDNPEGLLKPEMFANVRILTGAAETSPAVPREAIMQEGGTARLWVVHDDDAVELRPVKLGLSKGDLVQVLDGLKPGERVVTRGSLFIDRSPTGET